MDYEFQSFTFAGFRIPLQEAKHKVITWNLQFCQTFQAHKRIFVDVLDLVVF